MGTVIRDIRISNEYLFNFFLNLIPAQKNIKVIKDHLSEESKMVIYENMLSFYFLFSKPDTVLLSNFIE